jgi:hypothetical protein
VLLYRVDRLYESSKRLRRLVKRYLEEDSDKALGRLLLKKEARMNLALSFKTWWQTMFGRW